MSKKHPIQLSDHFTYARLFRFVLPSIVMMVFTSIYGVVDGLFVSNFAGKTAFASINLIMPFLIILYITVTSPGYFDACYSSAAGNILMTGCLSLYLFAYFLSCRLVEVEV